MILHRQIIYGPILSRRLGLSLGLNIINPFYKICSFDCLYCERGRTILHKNDINTEISSGFPTAAEITDALKYFTINFINSRLNFQQGRILDNITFSGNGEPTLHPDFDFIAEQVIKIRDKYLPDTKVTILSNSSTAMNPIIQKALSKLDTRIMKLDAGNEETFQKYNIPLRGVIQTDEITLKDITDGLKNLKDIIIQSLFTKGISGNYNRDNVTDWIEKIKLIKPLEVQIYTLDRAAASEDIEILELSELEEIKNLLDAEGIKSEIYY